MARKNKPAILKRIAIVGGALLLVQAGFILYFQQDAPPASMKAEIDKQIKSIPDLTPQRREQMRIQLAIDDFRQKQGNNPKSLAELVPVYFDAVPKDPDTGKAFAYSEKAGKYTLGQTSGATVVAAAGLADDGPPTAAEQAVLLASLDSPVDDQSFVYDSSGKRDPFRPFDLSVKPNEDCEKFPLTCFDVGQLRLSTVLLSNEEPKAMVDDATGIGHIVRKGSKIGRNNGEVTEILADRIRIVETLVDVTGQATSKVVELPIGKKDDAPKGSGSRSRTK
jgi:Tfp pilus assembly protein PilP